MEKENPELPAIPGITGDQSMNSPFSSSVAAPAANVDVPAVPPVLPAANNVSEQTNLHEPEVIEAPAVHTVTLQMPRVSEETPAPVESQKEVVIEQVSNPQQGKIPFVAIFGVMIGLLVVAIGGMLFFTSQGQQLVGVSMTMSSTISGTYSTESVGATEDYSSKTGEETIDQVVSDIDSESRKINSDEDFENFDSQVEFGL